MTTVREISLAGMTDAKQVLAAIGESLHLGGPDANHPVRPGETQGWGMNWDALFDCLLNLDSGGIWGNSPSPAFPLHLTFVEVRRFREQSPESFGILEDILEQTRDTYARLGKVFQFELRM